MAGTADRQLVAVQAPAAVVFTRLRAALAGGPAILPLAPRLPGPERDRVLAALRPQALVTGSATALLASAEPVAGDVAVVVATSGSTGIPKGVELTGAALEASAGAGLTRIGATEGDRWLCCLPVSHVAGLQVLVRSILLETAPTLHDRFDVAAVAGAPACGVTHTALVPTMLRRLLDAGADLRGYRRILLGGAAAPAELLERAVAAGVRIVTTYGMTETAGGCVYDGVPLDGVEVLIGADARIRVRGPVLARGYRLRPDLTAGAFAGGTFTTGDLGRWTPDGRLDVIGRADDVIVTGGENVAAGEVAELLARHPAVAEAAVVGRPDPEWGQRVVAVVVPADPAAPPDLAQLRAFVTAAAAARHAPRQLVVIDRLPLLPTGKVDREALREL
ncbi:o-succinylbenzoate--CoA ligase [soil metagenome]